MSKKKTKFINCSLCGLPLQGFEPTKKAAKKKGYCVREYCVQNQKRIKREEKEFENDVAREDSGEIPESELLLGEGEIENEKSNEFFIVDGEIQFCASCGIQLFVSDAEFDRKRCKKNGWEEPQEFVCQKKKCQQYRRAENDTKTVSEREGDAVDDAAATQVRIEDGRVTVEEKERVEGDGLISTKSDFRDDDTPLTVKVRMAAGLPLEPGKTPVGCYPVSISVSPVRKGEVIPAPPRVRDPKAEWERRQRKNEEDRKRRERACREEDKVYNRPPEPEPLPPPKDETEVIEREVQAIVDAKKKKEEEAKRKMVRKRRVRKPKIEETQPLRLLCGLSMRDLARVLDEPSFNRPVPMKDRELLYNPTSKFYRWHNELRANARDLGCDICQAKRRPSYVYNEVEDDVGPDERAEDVETLIIDGVAVSMSSAEAEALQNRSNSDNQVPPKFVYEPSTRKTHEVKQLPSVTKPFRSFKLKPKTKKQTSPRNYKELMDMLPFRMDLIVTPREKAFYKDLANSNLTRDQIRQKDGEFSQEDVFLIENRIVRHAFHTKLAQLLPEKNTKDIQGELEKGWDADLKMISKTSGATIGGGIHAGKLDRFGRVCKLDTFRTRPVETVSGWGSVVDRSGGVEFDEMGDESAA